MLEKTLNLESEDISSHGSSAVDEVCHKDSLVFVSLRWLIHRSITTCSLPAKCNGFIVGLEIQDYLVKVL